MFGNNADWVQRLLRVHNDNRTDLLLGHDLSDLQDRRRGSSMNYIVRHPFGNGAKLQQIDWLQNLADMLWRDDANQLLAIVDNRQVADLMLLKDLQRTHHCVAI